MIITGDQTREDCTMRALPICDRMNSEQFCTFCNVLTAVRDRAGLRGRDIESFRLGAPERGCTYVRFTSGISRREDEDEKGE